MKTKEIKRIKKEMSENVMNRGYYYSIYNSMKTEEVLYIMYDLLEEVGFNFFKSENDFFNYVVTKYIQQSNFQHFKKDLLPNLIGTSAGEYYEN